MHRRAKTFAILLQATMVLSAAEVDRRLPLDGVADEILVSLPSNHEEGGQYPAVFFYHGTSGRPQVSLIRGHTGDEDWIVVGMAYAKRGLLKLTPAGMDAEQRLFREVRDRLQAEVGLDPERVYVSGFSKGGWMSGLLLQKEKGVAGAAILGAGHRHRVQGVPRPLSKGTPVFIGVGRWDRNYPFSLKAYRFFEKAGARVEMETWRGLEHEFPDWGSPGLKEWFLLRNDKEPDLAVMEEDFINILALEGFERWWQLLQFRKRPYVQAAGGWVEKVDAARREMEQSDEAIAREARILQLSRRTLARELEDKTLQDIEEIVASYATIMESGGDSPQVATAGKDYHRVGAILDAARQQMEELEKQRKEIESENRGTDRQRRIGGNPLVR
jgi:predicted esterase